MGILDDDLDDSCDEIFVDATIVRTDAGVYTDGRWVDGAADAPVPVRVSLQPATADQVIRLPEGDRDRETLSVWTNYVLQVSNEQNKFKGDTMTFNGIKYRIAWKKPWFVGISHSEALAVRMDDQT